MTTNEIYKTSEEKMKKSIEVFIKELAGIRAGRANPAVLDKLSIEYYGTATPINQVAAISVPEPRILAIQPWDPSVVKSVEKAIMASDIGITPTSDGKVIRLSFPPLTEERRRDLIKTVHRYGEEVKVAVRNVRREAIDHYKVLKKNSDITEDDLKQEEKRMQDLTDKNCKEVDAIAAGKQKELLEI